MNPWGKPNENPKSDCSKCRAGWAESNFGCCQIANRPSDTPFTSWVAFSVCDNDIATVAAKFLPHSDDATALGSVKLAN